MYQYPMKMGTVSIPAITEARVMIIDFRTIIGTNGHSGRVFVPSGK
jgi:hypothetical protein